MSAASPGDSEGWIQEAFKRAFLAAQEKHRALADLALEVTMPHMRFLHYADVGGGLPPHLDLVRTDEKGRRSTHTFILYLSDCSGGGGETVLLHRMEDEHGDLTHQSCPSKKNIQRFLSGQRRGRSCCRRASQRAFAALSPPLPAPRAAHGGGPQAPAPWGAWNWDFWSACFSLAKLRLCYS